VGRDGRAVQQNSSHREHTASPERSYTRSIASLLAEVDLPAAAAEYAGDFEILPVTRGPSKAPLIPRGFLAASCDLATIERWWRRWPGANIGMRVPEGMLVLDIDPRSGGDQTLAELELKHGPLPPTMTSRSGRGDGGHHRWLLYPRGEVRGKLGPGLDVKTRRGFLIVPPSLHPSTGAPYRWSEPPEAPAHLPPGWVTLLRAAPARVVPPAPGQQRTLETSTLVSSYPRRAGEHGRNNALWWSLCRALEAGDQEAVDALQSAAAELGVPGWSIAKQLRGARKAVER